MKKKLVPIITVSLAAAFAAGPSFAHARPTSAAFLTIPQDQEKPPEKPPAHEPDAKPPAKSKEKSRQEENPPSRPANNNEEKPKLEKQPKPQQQKQDNKMSQNHNDQNQNKKSVHAQQNVHYSFRSQDKTTLKQHFDVQIRSVDRSHRAHIQVGGFIPQESVTVIQPVPVEVIGLLPPIPEGCVVGFWDGFIVVYYPDDFYVVSYVDIL